MGDKSPKSKKRGKEQKNAVKVEKEKQAKAKQDAPVTPTNAKKK